ncbi:hypothetical protein [Paenibacillus sp. MMS18-CY102]|uniref:hypothetical protein n=1 Tax=Paenibacillus sp. MMS18-CY102 TaxID=2682849 RepID=UPI001365FCF3|nr:hypothetical protein [Paenibacillus sp. MMS18-CY102]MWC31395.1 hypothetical protein [Paenibacillus sp. MMS18-CY102]
MKIKTLNELLIENNDIYILECHQDLIIVNNNYSGINLYNFDFELQHSIDIFENLIIHSVFKNPDRSEIMLYCPDNQVFIYVNLITKHQRKLEFTGDLEEYGLSNVYYWYEQEFVFLCGNKKIYRINTKLLSLDILEPSKVEIRYRSFNQILKDSRGFSLLTGDASSLIYEDTKNNELVYWNYSKNTRIVSKIPNGLGHQVIYLHNVFLSVHEKYIQAIKDGQEVARVDSATSFMFLRARQQSEYSNEFMVLRGRKSNVEECKITKYGIFN